MDASQLELFSSNQEPAAKSRFSPSMLAYLKTYEKAVMFIMGLLITAIIAFCFGVERGKQITARASLPRVDMAASTPVTPPVTQQVSLKQPQPPLNLQKQAVVNTPLEPEPVAATVLTQAPAVLKQGYAIQIASFEKKVNAQQEALSLKKKGYTTVILTRGKYLILCVGAYANKETANAVLAKLKKQYQGCFIRRL